MTSSNEYLITAKKLAKKAGLLAQELIGKTKMSIKADSSVVTEADKKVQDMIIGELAGLYPEHGIIAEESTALASNRPGGKSEYVWAIDPIDGTRNYAANLNLYCTSIGLLHKGSPIAGAIFCPDFDWLFSASDNSKAMLNDQPISVNDKTFSQKTVVAFTLSSFAKRPASLHELIEKCVLRNVGSVAMHLGIVSAGKMDAAINFSGKLWDVAAGALIAKQAGGEVLALDKNSKPIEQSAWPMSLENYTDQSVRLAVGNPKIIASIKEILS